MLINRKGEIAYVIVGDSKSILIPDLSEYRASSTRFRGLRLIHSHLNGEGLSDEDLTDLAMLRLDVIAAIEVLRDGLPGRVQIAHLIPENPENRYWIIQEAVPLSELGRDFISFIQELEGEFARQQKTRRIETTDRAILVRAERSANSSGEGSDSLAELKELARSAGVEVFDAIIQHRAVPDPKFLIGKGKLSSLVIRAMQLGANMLVFDHELTPAQVRSLSDFTELKIIDRTQLILDIFAQRAHSREGKIQVELAQLKYLLPRLTTMGKALSRLTGGIGARGPGETKLEIDRRRVRERIHLLDKEIRGIEKSRGQRRGKRDKTGIPVISLVGYTNAGKSTLLNAMTASSVVAEDRLFATLDPKSSRLRFPRDREAVITDTVGFIHNLPADLFAAFRATLDELKEADLLLHVVDISNPRFEDHIQAVNKILQDLEIANKPTLLLFNKADRFEDKSMLGDLSRRFEAIPIAALDPTTLPPLIDKLGLLIESR